jgi:hypothetical protein
MGIKKVIMGDDYPYKQFDRMIPELFAYFFRTFKVIAVVVVIVLFLAWVSGTILMNVNKKESAYKEPPPLPPYENPYKEELEKRMEESKPVEKEYVEIDWDEIPEEDLKYYQSSSDPYYE